MVPTDRELIGLAVGRSFSENPAVRPRPGAGRGPVPRTGAGGVSAMSATWIDRLERDGYAILDGVATPGRVAELIEATRDVRLGRSTTAGSTVAARSTAAGTCSGGSRKSAGWPGRAS